MAETIVLYRSEDGKDHTRLKDAEERDVYLRAKEMLYPVAGPNYSYGYDGPMSPWEPSAETVIRHRAVLRNLLLDLPEPEPRVKTEYVYHDRVKPLHWTTVTLWLSLGAAAGAWIHSWF